MIISPAFVIAAIYLTYKITRLTSIVLWYLLLALWWLATWPLTLIARRRVARRCCTSRKSRRVMPQFDPFLQVHRFNERMARTGRPSKGDRDVLYTRVPRPVGDAIREISEQTGMAISDVVAALAARSLGMTDLAPQPPRSFDQQELPLKTA